MATSGPCSKRTLFASSAARAEPVGYVVSRGGTFGIEDRRYHTLSGVEVVVIRWGPLGWLTPVPASDVITLASTFECDARKEAAGAMG